MDVCFELPGASGPTAPLFKVEDSEHARPPEFRRPGVYVNNYAMTTSGYGGWSVHFGNDFFFRAQLARGDDSADLDISWSTIEHMLSTGNVCDQAPLGAPQSPSPPPRCRRHRYATALIAVALTTTLATAALASAFSTAALTFSSQSPYTTHPP